MHLDSAAISSVSSAVKNLLDNSGSVPRLRCYGRSGALARPLGRAPARISTEPSLTVGLMHRQYANRTPLSGWKKSSCIDE